mgnify:CR=1 FL=1
MFKGLIAFLKTTKYSCQDSQVKMSSDNKHVYEPYTLRMLLFFRPNLIRDGAWLQNCFIFYVETLDRYMAVDLCLAPTKVV